MPIDGGDGRKAAPKRARNEVDDLLAGSWRIGQLAAEVEGIRAGRRTATHRMRDSGRFLNTRADMFGRMHGGGAPKRRRAEGNSGGSSDDSDDSDAAGAVHWVLERAAAPGTACPARWVPRVSAMMPAVLRMLGEMHALGPTPDATTNTTTATAARAATTVGDAPPPSAPTPTDFTVTDAEYDALRLDACCQPGVEGGGTVEGAGGAAHAANGSNAVAGARVPFRFSRMHTAALFRLLRTHGNNFFAVHDRFCEALERGSGRVPRERWPTVAEVTWRVVAVARAVLAARESALDSAIAAASAAASAAVPDGRAALPPWAAQLRMVLHRHPLRVAAPSATGHDAPAKQATTTATATPFYASLEAEEERRAALARRLAEAAATDVEAAAALSAVDAVALRAAALRRRVAAEPPAAAVWAEADAAMGAVCAAVDRASAALPTGAHSRIAECVLVTPVAGAPRLVREVEEALEEDLVEAVLASAADSVQAAVARLRMRMAANLAVLRHVQRWRNIAAQGAKVAADAAEVAAAYAGAPA